MIRHSLLYFFIRAGNGLVGIVTLAVFTRILSPHEYGIYALFVTVATICSSLLFQWLNVGVGRFYPMYEDKPGIIMSVAGQAYWIVSGVAALLILATMPFHEKVGLDPIGMAILLAVIIMQGRYSMALQVANAQRAPMRYAMCSWVRGVVTLLVGSALIVYGKEEHGAFLGFLAGFTITVVAYNPRLGLRIPKDDEIKQVSSALFRYGFPLTLTFLAIMVVNFADRLMIGWLLSASKVAPYAAAYDFVQQTIGALMNLFLLAVFPMIILSLKRDGEDAARSLLSKLGRAHISLGLPATVGMCLLSDQIALNIFGPEVSGDAASVMPWLAVAIFIAAFKSYYLDLSFQIPRLTKYLGYIASMMAGVNLALNLLLIPQFGILGAAWATLSAFCVGGFVSWKYGNTVFRMPELKREILKVSFASAIMGLALWSLPSFQGIWSLVLKILIGTAIYMLMAIIVNVSGARNLLYISLLRLTRQACGHCPRS